MASPTVAVVLAALVVLVAGARQRPVEPLTLARRARRWAVALGLALSAGCVSSDWQLVNGDGPPRPGVPCQIVTIWQNSVLYAPDPIKNGAPQPGLAARLYLFGPEIDFPMTGNGSLVVDLYDETDGTAVLRERLEVDPQTLKRLLKQDRIGWGYTVFFPLAQYRPEMTKLRLRTSYRQGKGLPLFTESVVTLAEGNGKLHVTSKVGPLAGGGPKK